MRPSARTIPPMETHDWRTYALQRQQNVRMPPRRRSWRLIIKTTAAIMMVTFLVHFVFTLFVLVYGIDIVWPEIVHHEYPLFVVAPVLITFLTLSGDALGIYYLMIVTSILASAAWFFLKGSKGYWAEMTLKAKSREHSPVFEVCGLMFAGLFIDYVIVILLEVWGMSPSRPTEGSETWDLLFALANASVWEEIITRVLLIGTPLIAVDFLRRKWQPRLRAYVLGGGFKIGFPETILVIVSSSIFGFAHFEGYGLWKVLPAAISGVMFGYLFLKFGIWASVMLHFGYDYLGMPTQVFDSSTSLQTVTIVGLLLWLGLGAIFFVYYLTRIGEFLTGKKYMESPAATAVQGGYQEMWYVPPQAPSYQDYSYNQSNYGYQEAPQQHAPAPGGHIGGYVCPSCGFTQARWIDGRFQCLRCGHLL